MPKRSAGIVLCRERNDETEIFLVHPGGPYWAKKDVAGWSIPKGEVEEGEELLDAARREFEEETGLELPPGELRALRSIRYSGGKTIHAWMLIGNADPTAIRSNSFELEWPPGSGRMAEFPEIDRAGWFSVDEARSKLHKGLRPLVDEVVGMIG